jgi:hypothetical protein
VKIYTREASRMAIEKQCASDVEAIISHRHDNGADLWTTPIGVSLREHHFQRWKVVPKLAGLAFCKKGQPSELTTMRYDEILRNLTK